MDYTLLATEITTDPARVGYAGMTDAEIAASLSAATIRIRQPVPMSVLRDNALRIGVFSAIIAAQRNPDLPGELWAICETVMRLPSIGVENVNMDEPASIQMFGALTQARIITPEQAAAIDALATARVVSRAEQIGLGGIVTVEDIERSRTWPQIEALRVRLANGYNLAVAALDAAQAVPDWREIVAMIEAA